MLSVDAQCVVVEFHFQHILLQPSSTRLLMHEEFYLLLSLEAISLNFKLKLQTDYSSGSSASPLVNGLVICMEERCSSVGLQREAE